MVTVKVHSLRIPVDTVYELGKALPIGFTHMSPRVGINMYIEGALMSGDARLTKEEEAALRALVEEIEQRLTEEMIRNVHS